VTDSSRVHEESIMAITEAKSVGSVVALWRYPVKSMIGEMLSATEVGDRGLLGDRAYALVDPETGKVASAKNPRKWGNLFDFRAVYDGPLDRAGPLPPARITFADQSTATTDEPGLDQRLSAQLGRPVRLAASVPEAPRIEGYWPDYQWLQTPDEVFEVELPPGTFFDCALVHLVTTATLAQFLSLNAQSRFDIRRFRPNFVIDVADGSAGFVENAWIGRTLMLGGEVRLRITEPCPRCVMTTLNQQDLPKDPSILRTIVEHNAGNVGVYAAVIQGGRVERGDAVALE
jgi:uncharacterized protein